MLLERRHDFNKAGEQKMSVKVGIPRALFYYTYYPMWQSFLEKLGAEVLFSNPTNKEILDAGIRETVNDACIPVKLFHGHVLALKDRVDFLWVPRLVSSGGYVTYCPKFLGLPDMIRYSGMKLPALIDNRLDLRGLPGGLSRFLRATASSLGFKNLAAQQKALFFALKQHSFYQRLLLDGIHPLKALSASGEKGKPDQLAAPDLAAAKAPEVLTVALLGYPYTIYDSFVSADIYQKLQDMGAAVITVEQIPPKELRHMSRILPQNFFWHYSNRVCWAGLSLLNRKAVDGIIHITAFGCGPDAMVDKVLELEAKKAKVPFLTLTIDEHTGDGGVQTRVEAFTDMLLAKKENHR
jgi:predicted nucleotide-binding protein (sugar kinase/HSP70/actin superfamily)